MIYGQFVFADQTLVRVPQGWSPVEIEKVYSTYEGSQLMPLVWFLNLELPGSQKKFIENASAYGLVREPGRTLPIGFVSADDERTQKLYGEKTWVGVNCVACHTGVVQLKNRLVVIEGGQSLFDIQKFERDLIASVSATLSDEQKLERFYARLKDAERESDQSNLQTRLTLFRDEFESWFRRNHRFVDAKNLEVPFGPSRIDGLGGATNDLICQLTDRLSNPLLAGVLTDARNCRDSHPPSSIPRIWGITEEQFAQWNGAVHSSLGRNFGQATATYGKNWIELGAGAKPRLRSTANIDGLYQLEEEYKKLRPVRWSQLAERGLVEELNLEKAKRGSTHFQQHCASCHALQLRLRPLISLATLIG